LRRVGVGGLYLALSTGKDERSSLRDVLIEPQAKVNSQYITDEKVLGQGLLPDIRGRYGRYNLQVDA